MAGLPASLMAQRRIRRVLQQCRMSVNTRARSVTEIGSTLALLFSRRYWWKTLIVLLAMAAMAALGFWQMDRLEQRRAFNQLRQAALAAPPYELTGAPLPPGNLRDRQAIAHGEFDYARQVAIRNQNFEGQPGFHLVTPLRITGSDMAVLVNRGWIPAKETDPATWPIFDEQRSGPQMGVLQPTRRRPDGTVSEIPQDTVTGWYRLDIEAIGQTLPYQLIPVVLQLVPGNGENQNSRSTQTGSQATIQPRRIQQDLSLDEGNHMSYALQWFGFAITAAVVYISVARRAETRPQ